MDTVGLSVLVTEIEIDCAVIQAAARKAELRLSETTDGRLEACAFELARLYNVFERILESICTGFENHLEKKGDYHEHLIRRLAATLPGLRPAFIPSDMVEAVRDLKGFRHRVRHAYVIVFEEDRLKRLVNRARQLAEQFPAWTKGFDEQVRAEQGWT